jgi:arylsulfatase A-like enzyme
MRRGGESANLGTTDHPLPAIPGSSTPGRKGYHPSGLLRRFLGPARSGPEHATAHPGEAVADSSPKKTGGAWLSWIGAALAVGVAAGFLELAVFGFQVHGLHRAGVGYLRISRHVAWMVPVAETLIVTPLALALIAPALLWESRRARRGVTVSWARGWAGLVLGTLLCLGPLMAIRGLYHEAALALALGIGFRIRRWVAGPTPGWNRAARWAGLVAIGILSTYSYGQWSRVAHAARRAWSLPGTQTSQAPNLLWIVMDTVRADRMSLYGHARSTTPELQRWSARGITFDAARSGASWTLPSHITMFTGLWPSQHGARVDRPYSGASPTIAEHLGRSGYATAGFVANTGMCNACYGVGRGFDTYADLWCNHEVSLQATLLNSALGTRSLKLLSKLGMPVPTEFPYVGRRLAPRIITEATQWLEEHRRRSEAFGSARPFFLFLNFMDVHGPYFPSTVVPRVFSADRPVPPRQQAVPSTGWAALQAVRSASPDDRPQRQRELDETSRLLGDLYDDCLRGLDHQLGRFLDQLEASGSLEKTWVVITSDHGEYLGEHELFGHGCGLHDEVTHVPLVLIPPLSRDRNGDDPAAAWRGRRISAPVSQRDLPSTVTPILLPGATHPFPGRSLARHWLGSDPGPADPVLSQMEHQPFAGDDVPVHDFVTTDALIHEGRVLIQSETQAPELHDLLADPDRLRNLADEPTEQARLKRLRDTLKRLREGVPPAQLGVDFAR